MQIETLQYQNATGWSAAFPKLDSENTLLINFFSPEYINNTVPFTELRKAYPNATIVGCSTSGEILQNEIYDNSISTAIVRFDKSKIDFVTLDIKDPGDSFLTGEKIGKALRKPDLKAIFILSDGLNVNGSTLTQGIRSQVDSSIIITGGLAGDGKDFQKTAVLKDHLPATQCVCAVGLYGNELSINYGSQGGWDIFGPERVITRAKGNVLYEIDGQPALALYKKYLGDQAKGLPASGLLFPLAISEKPMSKNQVVRTILGIDESNQSMTFAGDIPEGWYGQLMRANNDRLVEGAMKAGQLAKDERDNPMNTLAIAISCVGRRLVLGERSDEEIEATHEILGNNMPLIGFYSYGEISPSSENSCDLHNQTMTLTTLSEHQ